MVHEIRAEGIPRNSFADDEAVRGGAPADEDLTSIAPEVLKANPNIRPMLRMATCPPLARDRLTGLAYASKSLVLSTGCAAGFPETLLV
ncbi:MAG: XamI family restriction endonuclease [Bryobacterales bacterium]|nr:XamI family restriction endonuclease [Bryobacterales bacterium]